MSPETLTEAPSAAAIAAAPLAIEVRDLKKHFRIPEHKVDSLKERLVRPFAARDYRELRALDGISFDVHKGEFFGIVGRNGSGKSTLLKLMASIYRADAGTIRMAGRLAPFIELGVGFNVELSARENVVLNGVMMGLSPKETRGRLDAVLEFAELRDFVDLKLKNYSSGMLVRLAFSTMMQSEADILLIDEVLAVGDAAFQQKCADAFHRIKAEGKTVILVTHEMTTVEEYCHRAMLIHDGHVRAIGDPGEIGRQYLRLNFAPSADVEGQPAPSLSDGARLLNAWLEDENGERVAGFEHGQKIRLRFEIEMTTATSGAGVGLIVANADAVGMFQFGAPVYSAAGSRDLQAGERVTVRADLENPLAPGRYYVHFGVQQDEAKGNAALYAHSAIDFVVFGGKHVGGVLSLDHEIEALGEGPGS